MGIKISSVKADIAKEKDGDWIAIPDLLDVQLRVRSIHFPPYTAAVNLAQRRAIKRYGDDLVPEIESARVIGTLLVEHLLLDWRGLIDDDGKEFSFTQERAREILTDVGYRALRDHVVWAARQVGHRDIEFVEAAAKNSDAPSAGG